VPRMIRPHTQKRTCGSWQVHTIVPQREDMGYTWVATWLDWEMLRNRSVQVAPAIPPPPTSVGLSPGLFGMARKSGQDVYKEIGGRYLLRYVREWQVGSFQNGSGNFHYVTPTLYRSTDAVAPLFLPAGDRPPPFAMLLDPRKIPEIWGPRFVYLGFGIEYVLPMGFTKQAIVGNWEISIS
jgi:hypothetical protein